MTQATPDNMVWIEYTLDDDVFTEYWTEENQDFCAELGWTAFMGDDAWDDLPPHILAIICEGGIV